MRKYLLTNFITVSVTLFCQNDTVREYSVSGNLIKQGQYIWKRDAKFTERFQEGQWKYFNDSTGNVSLIENFKSGLLDGPYIEYYFNGIVKLKGQYSYKAHNMIKEKDENGNLIGYLSEALPVGIWEYYDEKGKLQKRVTYSKKGKKIKEEIW